jgi:hypothetical protein
MSTYNLSDIFSDVNGCSSYTEDIAAMGTIPSEFHIYIPTPLEGILSKDLTAPFKRVGALPEKAFSDFLRINVKKLMEGKLSANDAAFCALLKWQGVINGALGLSPAIRSVTINEVEFIESTEAEKEAFPAGITRDMVRFTSTYWSNIFSVVAHVFRVRGHHWKAEYRSLYDRTWASITVETPNFMPDWEVISRAAVHCFGIKAIHYLAVHCARNGELAKGLVLRLNAACAGTASVQTSAAALNEMKSATWYTFLARHKREAIEHLETEAERLRVLSVAAHINYRLYGFSGAPIMVDDSSTRTLAPYILGWIDILDDNEPIKKQKAINKKGQGSAMVRVGFTQALNNEIKGTIKNENIEAFFNTDEYEVKKAAKDSERRRGEYEAIAALLRVGK